MKSIDIATVETIIAEVAAIEIMPRFRRLEKHEVETKQDKTFVTIADRETEKALTARLQDYLPGSVIVGEESYEHTPEMMSLFEDDHDIWVIDPIDGTRPFVEGRHGFAVMIALVRQRKTVASWIYDPVTGDTLAAEQGSGAWLRSKKMRLAGRDPDFPHGGILGSRVKKAMKQSEAAPVLASLAALEVGAASSYDYGRLFTGETLFAGSAQARVSFLIYHHPKAWDHLPGLFLHEESGGYAADFFGKPYDARKPDRGLLVTSDPNEWRRLYEGFKLVIESLTAM